jgi:hypothetical protein
MVSTLEAPESRPSARSPVSAGESGGGARFLSVSSAPVTTASGRGVEKSARRLAREEEEEEKEEEEEEEEEAVRTARERAEVSLLRRAVRSGGDLEVDCRAREAAAEATRVAREARWEDSAAAAIATAACAAAALLALKAPVVLPETPLALKALAPAAVAAAVAAAAAEEKAPMEACTMISVENGSSWAAGEEAVARRAPRKAEEAAGEAAVEGGRARGATHVLSVAAKATPPRASQA